MVPAHFQISGAFSFCLFLFCCCQSAGWSLEAQELIVSCLLASQAPVSHMKEDHSGMFCSQRPGLIELTLPGAVSTGHPDQSCAVGSNWLAFRAACRQTCTIKRDSPRKSTMPPFPLSAAPLPVQFNRDRRRIRRGVCLFWGLLCARLLHCTHLLAPAWPFSALFEKVQCVDQCEMLTRHFGQVSGNTVSSV